MSRTNVRTQEIAPEMRQKMLDAIHAVSGQKVRYLYCPHCKHKLFGVYEDAVGHFRFKCNKCGNETTYNVMSMRRIKIVR